MALAVLERLDRRSIRQIDGHDEAGWLDEAKPLQVREDLRIEFRHDQFVSGQR